MSQWAEQLMPQNSDFPFQPTGPKNVCPNRILGVEEGLAAMDVKETEPLPPFHWIPSLWVESRRSSRLTKAS